MGCGTEIPPKRKKEPPWNQETNKEPQKRRRGGVVYENWLIPLTGNTSGFLVHGIFVAGDSVGERRRRWWVFIKWEMVDGRMGYIMRYADGTESWNGSTLSADSQLMHDAKSLAPYIWFFHSLIFFLKKSFWWSRGDGRAWKRKLHSPPPWIFLFVLRAK